MTRRKRIVSLLLAVGLGLSITACGGDNAADTTQDPEPSSPSSNPSAQAEENDTFTAAINSMPAALTPTELTAGDDDYVSLTRPLYDRLFQETADGFDYYLADSVTISDDGLLYTVHLNEDATWSDGKPITVDDCLLYVNYSIAKTGRSNLASVNGQDVTFNKVDDKTLEITLPEPYAYYIVYLSNCSPYPAHIFDNDPNKMLEDTTYYTKPGMVTSGPYTVSEINEDSLVYTARDDYYRGTPQVKTIIMKTTGTGASRAVAFENGEIDYMRITTAEELEKYSGQPDQYNIFSIPEARLNYLQINPEGPAALTLEQRQALFYAINGQEVIDAAYGSDQLATTANTLLTPEQSLYNPACQGYTYDLDLAKQMAEESGLSGKSLTYIYNSERPNMEAIAIVLEQQLAQIGVTLQIEGLDTSTFFDRMYANMYGTGLENTWDLGTNGWDSMRGSTLRLAFGALSGNSGYWGFSDQVADLALSVNTTADPSVSKERAYELQDLAMSEHWIYPLTYTNYVMVAHKNVEGLDCSPVIPEFVDWLGITVNN